MDLLNMVEKMLKPKVTNKYKIDFANGTAKEYTKSRIHNHKIFLDDKGAYILKRDGKVYLDEENSEVL